MVHLFARSQGVDVGIDARQVLAGWDKNSPESWPRFDAEDKVNLDRVAAALFVENCRRLMKPSESDLSDCAAFAFKVAAEFVAVRKALKAEGLEQRRQAAKEAARAAA